LKQILAAVNSNTELMPGVNIMWIEAPDIAVAAQPGQFITVRCEWLTLRRPFSIHQVAIAGEPNQSQVALLFNVLGRGTLWLSQLRRGDRIDILGPLGKGFNIDREGTNLLLVAGGIGIAPIVFLAQNASAQHSMTLIHGANTAARLCQPQSLPEPLRFVPVTEDGSVGQKGAVTDALPHFLDWADQIFACGPVDMYRAMAAMSLQAKRSNLKLRECQVSLEVRMGCGIGACYACTLKTKKGLKQVCRDGPIFRLDDIIWREVRI
jgi:dihydroorotate dehydrogenase electron transfer subunit